MGERPSTSSWVSRAFEPVAENPVLFVLLLVLTLFMLIFGAQSGLVGDSLHHRVYLPVTYRGIELVIIPLAALVSTRWRFAADRLLALRESRLASYLPFLMAASLVGLIAYLVWSWETAWNTIGPDQFGVVRWLGTVLTAAFTIIWMPLFPRITATLAGAIAGPTLFGLVGYTLFESHMRVTQGSDGPGMGAFVLAVLSMPVWIVGAGWLSQWRLDDESSQKWGHVLSHAVWSGLVMLGLAFAGIKLP